MCLARGIPLVGARHSGGVAVVVVVVVVARDVFFPCTVQLGQGELNSDARFEAGGVPIGVGVRLRSVAEEVGGDQIAVA